MAVCNDDLFDKVFFLGGHADDALAAAVLRSVGIGGQALDIAGIGQREHTGVTLDQILEVDIFLCLDDRRAALVGELILDLGELVADDALDLFFIGEDRAQLCHALGQIRKSLLDLLALHARELTERHIDDRLCLLIREQEALHQSRLCRRNGFALFDQGNDLVDVVDRNLVALVNMHLRQRFIQIELGAAGDDLLLELDVVTEDVFEREDLRHAVFEREHVDREGALQLGEPIELVENDLRVGIAAVIDDDAHARLSALVADIGDSLNALFIDKVGDGLDQHRLVDHVGDLGEDDAVFVFLNLGGRADDDSTLTRFIRVADALGTVDGRIGREVGALDVLHQLRHGDVGVLHHGKRAVDDLAEVVRGDIGRHTDGDTHGTVDE